MSVSAKKLVGLIREVVKKEVKRAVVTEVKKQLPSVLSELYVRKIVNESVGSRKKRTELHEKLMDDDIDEEDLEIPRPLDNTDKGIYQSNPLINDREEEEVNELLSQSNPLSFVYENVKLPGETGGKISNLDVLHGKTQKNQQVTPQPSSNWADIVKKLESSDKDKKPMANPSQKQRDIEIMREQLDNQKV